jgi:phosphoglycerate dehydrogenase-like enzyme
MGNLSVFCDSGFGEGAERRLRDGISPHSLLLPEKPGESVLAVASRDPLFDRAEIAFGQPSVESVLGSSRLRWLQVTSAGFTRYDTPEFRSAAAARGLMVTNSSSVFAEPCAEHLFAFMLAQARRLPTTLHLRGPGGVAWWLELRQGCFCLEGQHAVILGYGAIGRRLTELLAPLRMTITAMRRNPSGTEGIRVVEPSQLAPVLATADHVINIIPANADSRHFFSSERFGQMKRGAIFYNIGRGSTVDQPALVEALQSGHLGAAWLDVTDPEPLPESDPLWTAPRCYITPHLAGGHHDEEGSMVAHFLRNFQRFVAGTPLADRIM